MKYILSKKANNNLVNIWEYTFENWSIEQADRYIRIISSKFKEICKNLDLGKNYKGVRKNYRGLAVKSHIIFYKIRDEKIIDVIRVLHQRIDLINRIEES